MTSVSENLFSMKDEEYRDFNSKLIPTVAPEKVIGVRTPFLRAYAKEFYKTDEAEKFLNSLPHTYYEENNLHAYLIEQIKDFDEALKRTDEFLPYIDNWGTCDTFLPPIFKKNTDLLLPQIKKWLKSDKTYTVRYALKLLMALFLDEKFSLDYLDAAAQKVSDEYYVNMMIAWYFATALAKQYESAVAYLTDKKLPPWVHNKTIQKAVESRRISPEKKAYLKTLKIK